MNWVGGSRKRITFTKERRKQKDFFEKERLKSKMKVLERSPPKHSVNSLDLVNLHVVNQISTNKKFPGKVQKPVYVDINQVPGRWCSIELPKTPEHKRPKPFLDDVQNRLQEEILENKRKYLPEKENLWFEPANIVHEESWLSKEAHKPGNFSGPECEKPLALNFQQLSSLKGILEEPNLDHLHTFGLEEIEEEVCSNHSQTLKPTKENDDESQLSSQSPSYSPEQAERCASLTSDESTEEDRDGNMSSCYENYIPRNEGSPLTIFGNHPVDMPFILHNPVTTEKANIRPQVKPTVDLRENDVVLPLQITSRGSFKNKHVNFKTMHNAWSQTEKCAWETEKSEAAVQCDIVQGCCSCKREMSSVHSAEIVTSTSKIETTGGQSIPADRGAFQPSSTSSTVLVKGLPSESE